jgi:hypothetical protein
MKKIILIILSLSLFGCITEQNYKKVVETWINAPESSLVSSWGAPSSSYTASNGDRILSYSTDRYATIPYGNIIKFGCKTSFTIDSKTNLVRSYTYSGNDCASY